MRECPQCKRSYSDDTLVFCLDDGSRLMRASADAATLQMPSPRPTMPPPTEVLPQNPAQPQHKKSRWIIPVSVTAVLLVFAIGGLALAWAVFGKRDSTTDANATPPTSQNDQGWSSATKDSPSWKLVGTWRAEVEELGIPTTITYTFHADGTSESTFTDSHGKTGAPSHGSWRYSDGILFETYEDGSSGRCSIEWRDDNTYELTILDNGVPAYSGLKRLYKRVT